MDSYTLGALFPISHSERATMFRCLLQNKQNGHSGMDGFCNFPRRVLWSWIRLRKWELTELELWSRKGTLTRKEAMCFSCQTWLCESAMYVDNTYGIMHYASIWSVIQKWMRVMVTLWEVDTQLEARPLMLICFKDRASGLERWFNR